MRVYDILVSSTQDIDEAVELTVATGQLVVQLGGSPAQWYLRELRLQLMRGDAVRVAELFRRLQTHHRHEPGVSEALHSLLVQIGALTPDGRPTDRAMMAAQQQTATQAPAPGGLWTPDSPPAAAEGQEKSKLWMPGMP
jgi:hypothetical protein